MLFNIFINDLFLIDLELEECNIVDDNRIYTRGDNLEEETIKLGDDLNTILQWFYENEMVANPEQFHLTFVGANSDQKLCVKTNDQIINQCQ